MKVKTIPIGTRYSRWTVLRFAYIKNKNAYWHCRCDCGNEGVVVRYALTSGSSQSCGCWAIELTKMRNRKHGHTANRRPSPTWKSWDSIKQRCLNSNDSHFPDYGGRGIAVCERWLESFENFLEDMGERPAGKSIDRRDVDGNYEPGNCRWATIKEQNRNTRQSVKVAYKGIVLNRIDWSRMSGIPDSTLTRLLGRGLSLEQCFKQYGGMKKQRRGVDARDI